MQNFFACSREATKTTNTENNTNLAKCSNGNCGPEFNKIHLDVFVSTPTRIKKAHGFEISDYEANIFLSCSGHCKRTFTRELFEIRKKNKKKYKFWIHITFFTVMHVGLYALKLTTFVNSTLIWTVHKWLCRVSIIYRTPAMIFMSLKQAWFYIQLSKNYSQEKGPPSKFLFWNIESFKLCFQFCISLELESSLVLFLELMPCALQGSDGHLNVCGLRKRETYGSKQAKPQ